MESSGWPPHPLTSFVGRVDELRSLGDLLATERLVTVAGPGGVGKTRIAVEVARRVSGTSEVGWVDLAGAAESRVASQLAEAAGLLIRDDDSARALGRQLAGRRLLLVLDSCEHAIDAVAQLVTAVLREAPGLTVLATSREPLGIGGEHVFRLPPLSLDEAIELFRERAVVAPAVEHEASIRLACARLDGIPLAVELAAAWTAALSPSQILDGLDDRFALLVRSTRGTTPRHQTLLASMQWSHDLLDEPERVLLRRVGVFAGPFTLGLATRVCGDVPADRSTVRDLLGRLIDTSLVVAETAGVEARYRLLETVREFAVARLVAAGEANRLEQRLVVELRDWVGELRPVLDENVDAWRTRLVPLADTLEAAVEIGLRLDDPTPARELAAELAHLWHSSASGRDGIRLLRDALTGIDRQRTVLTARLLAGLALVADTTAPMGLEYDAAHAAFEIAELVGDQRTASLSLLLSAVGVFYGDLADGERLALRALRLGADAGYPYVEYGATALLGIIAHLRDRHQDAADLLHRAVDDLERIGERGIASTALGFLALSALYTGRRADAQEFAQRSVDVARPLNDLHRAGSAYGVRAIVQATSGDFAAARASLGPLSGMLDDPADAPFVPVLGRAIGQLTLWEGRPREAADWLRRSVPDRSTGATYLSVEHEATLVVALRIAGDTEDARALADRVLAEARLLGLPRMVANVLDESAALTDDRSDAESRLFEALALRAAHGLRPDLIRSLDAVADRWASSGDGEDAMRLRVAVQAARDTAAAGEEESVGLHAARDGAAARAMSLDEAAAFALRSRGPRGRPATGWASLTPTEREVVRLAALGLSNPEIGARLFMSRATVKTHLSHVFGKLGVTNRTELAAEAAARPDV